MLASAAAALDVTTRRQVASTEGDDQEAWAGKKDTRKMSASDQVSSAEEGYKEACTSTERVQRHNKTIALNLTPDSKLAAIALACSDQSFAPLHSFSLPRRAIEGHR